jgi:hypothetical protein
MTDNFTRRGFITGLTTLLAAAKALARGPGASTPPPTDKDKRPPTETLLLRCHIAGTAYRDLDAVEPRLQAGDVLRLRREPENPYDTLAIAVYDPRGAHLGYIPRAKNQVLARLLDAGRPLHARLTGKEWLNYWLKLDVEVYLQEER